MQIRQRHGFTLVEVIFVIALIATVYAVALPQLGIITGSDTAERLGQLTSDIRSAYDMAVLQNKPYRMVFMLHSGNYWLEEPNKREFYLSDEKIPRELTAEEEAAELRAFDESFEEYKQLSGELYRDASTDKTIPSFSPVLQAAEKLRPVSWRRVENMEWRQRSIGPSMIFKSFRAEHNLEAQTLYNAVEGARGVLYFFPRGYVEQCVMVIGMRQGSREVEESGTFYTVSCDSATGVAEIVVGEKEVEFKENDR